MGVALAPGVAGGAVLLQRAPPGLDGARDVVDQVALVRAALEQLGAALALQVGAVAQRAGELRGRLAMGAEHRRALAGGGRVEQHRVGVAGGLRVMREAGGIRASAVRGERRQRRAVERQAPVRRQRVLDRDARDLVAEADGVALRAQHPRGQAFVEVVELALGERVEQPQLGARRRDGDGVQQHPRPVAQARGAGQHRVADGLGQLGVGAGQHLGDEERVAGGRPVQRFVIDRRRPGERGHRLGRQRRQRHALRRAAGQLAEDDPQRVGSIELVVAIGRQHQRRQRLDAASEQAHDVERGLVGPVEVLEHDDARRPAAQLARQRRDELARRRAVRGDRRELAADLVGDVDERPERARRVQRVAGPPEHPDRAAALAEGAHERRLADPGLAGDEDQPSAPLRSHRAEQLVEDLELRGALEQLAGAGGQLVGHGHMFAAARRRAEWPRPPRGLPALPIPPRGID